MFDNLSEGNLDNPEYSYFVTNTYRIGTIANLKNAVISLKGRKKLNLLLYPAVESVSYKERKQFKLIATTDLI